MGFDTARPSCVESETIPYELLVITVMIDVAVFSFRNSLFSKCLLIYRYVKE
jgi:hypothetical protein